MTRREKIEELQDMVWHNKISNIDDLKLEISCAEYDGEETIEPIDDILAPLGFTHCDRCGECGDSEQDFLWVDSYDWWREDENDKAILKAIEIEGADYYALCWDCISELKKKGEKTMTQNEYDYKVGYLDAMSDALAMLASIPETPEVHKIKESLRKTIEEGSEEL